MRGVYAVAVLFVATLTAVALGASPQDDEIPTRCPDVDPKNTTIHLAHEYDCTKFYMCLRGEKILMECPWMDEAHTRRLHFNRKLQVCDWPSNAGCKEGSTTTPPTTTTITPDPEPTPTTPETITLTGSSSITDPGDITTVSLIPSSTIRDEDTTTTIIIKPTTTSQPSVTTSTITPKPPTKPPTTTPMPTPPIPTACPSFTDGKTIRIPHEIYCDLYYECTDGVKVLKECPYGNIFNPVFRVCDFPENVQCEGTIRQDCTKEEEGRKYAHESSCSDYYECVNRRKILKHCEPVHQFNVMLEMCEYSDKKCLISTPTLPDLSTTVKLTTERTTTAIDDGECPNDGTNNVRFPHKTDCRLYYECINGKKVERSCGEGFVFNPQLRVCDFPENVKECGSEITTPRSTTKPADPDVCPPKGSSEKRMLPHECDCTKYYLCKDGYQVLQVCPKGLLYDFEYAICDRPEIAKCSQLIPTPTIPPPISSSCTGKKDGTRVPNKNDCSSYYICSDGLKIPATCNKGLYFNPNLGVCDFPENVYCSADNNIADPNYPSKFSGCIGDCPWEDPVNRTILIPHQNCHKFCMCHAGVGIEQDCPADLLFDYIREVCDYPPKVQCKVPPEGLF